ncbi:MAG: nitroreductase family protein [Propionibacteriaceae bacterium]|jgi:nitroreductase|nr:nitroreductase family protein [Propionibacteriaceae bacterium]
MSEVNDVVTAVKRRRTVRAGFRAVAADAETIRQVIEAGLLAPSAKNSQPWRLHVVSDQSLLERLAALVRAGGQLDEYVPHDPRTGKPHSYKSTVEGSAAILESVSFAVLVENVGPFSGGPEVIRAASPEALASSLFGYGEEWFGIGACVQNMWLTAVSLGLAAAFLADVAIAEAEWRAVLGFEGELVGALAVGFSDDVPGPKCDAPFSPGLSRAVWHGPSGQPQAGPAQTRSASSSAAGA